MRQFQTSEFDRASAPKVRPPANRARPNDRPTMNLAVARVNAARHRKLTASELVDTPVTRTNVRPPTPRGQPAPTSPRTSARVGAGQMQHHSCERALEPQLCLEERPPANGARHDKLPTTPKSRAAHPTRQSCLMQRFRRITEGLVHLTSNAALTRCGTIVWFERRDCSAIGLNA